MASRRARKQPPAFQGISSAPAWSGGAEHISLPAPIPPQDGQGWQSFICLRARLAEPLAEPLLSSSSVNPWGSSKPPRGTCLLPCEPLSAARKHQALHSCSKAAALPSNCFFFLHSLWKPM